MNNFLRIITILIFQFFCFSLSAAEIYDLRCNKLSNPLGINSLTPSLEWKVRSIFKGDFQTHYRIIAAASVDKLNSNIGDLWDSGKIKSSEQIGINYNGMPLESGKILYWKVKIWTEKEKEQEWSKPSLFSIGMLDSSDWKGQFICFNPIGVRNIDSPLFWKSFKIVPNNNKYLLHVNSLGYHEVYLNGEKVGDVVLQPAVSQTNKRSLICTYDLSDIIKSGRNDLVLWLSDGWFRTDGEDRLSQFSTVRAQLQEINELGEVRDILYTDPTWQVRESGYSSMGSWRPFEFGGEEVDANVMLDNFTASELDQHVWGKAEIAIVKEHTATPQMVEPTRIMNTVTPVAVERYGEESWIVDFGTCLTGFVEIGFPRLQKDQRITIEYFDSIESDGKLQENRRGQFSDLYIASGNDKEKFINRFNFHGFRYIKISGSRSKQIVNDIKAHLIHTDYGKGATFSSSDKDLNDIHNMINYTIRCLTPTGYMIDCPHIERLGYGGDGNASTPTLQTMYNVSPLIYNWVQAWTDAQLPDGSMPHTAPAPYGAGGGPYWCGFFIIASWQNYIHYNDSRLITEFYPQMKLWLDYVEKYSKGYLLGKWAKDPIRRNYFLGDWAAPEDVNVADSSSVEIVNNCFVAICYETMSKIAKYNDNKEDCNNFRKRAEKIKSKLQNKHYDAINKAYGTSSQIDLCYPMLVNVTPKSLVADVTKTLKQLTKEKYNGHLTTGLVGINIVTQWATMAKETDFMYGMLKKRDYPGYLDMIDKGATTTWEYWNGYRSRIHNCYNGIGLWFYEALGGIMPDEKNPGYRHMFISPQIVEGVKFVKVSQPTPYGDVRSEWVIENNEFSLSVFVPFGSSATIILPQSNRKHKIGSGQYIFKTKI